MGVKMSVNGDDNDGHTIEYGVGDQSARVDDLITDSCKGLAISIFQVVYRAMLAIQLLRIVTLNVTTMVLEEVGELVIEQYGGCDVERDFKLDDALGRGGIDERILGRRELGVGL